MIKDLINNFIENWAQKNELYLKLGVVTSVNESEFTYTIKPNTGDGDIDIDMTMQGSSESAFVIIPKVDSLALVGFVDNANAYTIWIEKSESILINGGSNGGLINIGELTSKLNSLVNEVISLKNYINGHTHPVAGALASSPVPPFLGSFSNFSKSDYEDEKIKH